MWKTKSRLTRVLSVALSFSLVVGICPITPVKAAQEDEWTATPYYKEDGTFVEGLEEAVQGKKHWLETTEPMPVTVEENADSLVMENGVIQRTFRIPEKGETGFYTTSYKNQYIDKELLKEEYLPDVYLGLYDDVYRNIYEGETIKKSPDYYYVGGTQTENTFVFDHYEVVDVCEKPFDWSPHPKYGDPAAEDWPPKGKHVEFYFTAPADFPEKYQGIEIKVIYEMFDTIASMKKRVEIVNNGEESITIGRIAPEVLNGNDDMKELMHLQYDYTCGADGTVPYRTPLPCTCGSEGENSAFEIVKDTVHTCYEIGPAYQLDKGQELITFNTYELVFSTYWFELQSRERLAMYRKLFPWITDNPLTLHNTGALTKELIDRVEQCGYEMIIQSYGAPGPNQMLARDQATLDKYKEIIDYAHTKGVDIGFYQAQYQRGEYMKGAEYGTNGIGKWGTWCMASAAWDDYWDNFKYFVKYTGADCVEIDGTYPGCACNNGEKHVNEDRETDPDEEGTDKTIGTPSKYSVHNGYYDSVVKQWENAVRMLSHDFRELGVYIKVPAWYYMSGGNKCGIGYEEAAWSQPRHEQLLYGRQLMHNASYARTMTMSWSHVPFAQYHGGGSDAMFTPFKDHKEEYNWVLAQYIGNGVASDYRGTDLCDDETLPILNKWVDFYKRYRGIINSDMLHISQAMYDSEDGNRARGVKMDTLYHVNATNDGEKGLLWVYNQTDKPRTEIITVPMYYTGLTKMNYPAVPVKGSLGKNVHSYGTYPPNYSWLPTQESNYKLQESNETENGSAAFVREGVQVQNMSIDSNGNVQLEVKLPAMSFTYYTIYEDGQAPQIELEVGAVTNVKETNKTENTVTLNWDKDVDVIYKENGVINPNPAVTVESYKVYRDGVLVGSTMGNTFVDKELEESKEYTYTVSAVISGIEGQESQPIAVTTIKDEVKPEVLYVEAPSKNQVIVTYNEAVEEASAINVDNYQFEKNVSITNIEFVENSGKRKVLLTTSDLKELESNTLKITNIKDASLAGNVIEDSKRDVIFGYIVKYSMNQIEDSQIQDNFSTKKAEVYEAKIVDGGIGKGLEFKSDKKAYVDLGVNNLNNRDQYSVSMWVQSDKAEKQVLLSQGQDAMEKSDWTLYTEENKPCFTISNKEGDKRVTLNSATTLESGKLNLITLVRDKDNMMLYLNGKQVAKENVAGIEVLDNANAMLLGAIKNHAGGDRTLFYDGIIDEVALYLVALDDETVENVYYQNPMFYQGILDKTNQMQEKYYTETSFSAMINARTALVEALESGTQSTKFILEKVENLNTAVDQMQKRTKYKGLESYYNMNEASGTVLEDSVSGNMGELINGSYFRMGTPFERGVYISSLVNNYIKVDDSKIANKDVFTISGWLKEQVISEEEQLAAGKQTVLADNAGGLILSVEHNKLVLEVAGTEPITMEAKQELATDKVTGGEIRQAWNHFAIVKSEDKIQLYLNGEEVASSLCNKVNLGTGLLFGAKPGENGAVEQVFNGLLDEIKVYSNVLDTQSINEESESIIYDKGTLTNVAYKKDLNSDSMDDAFRLNDGKVLDFAGKDTPWTARSRTDSAVKYEIDLGEEYEIGMISLTQFFRDFGNDSIRRFEDVVIQTSTTPDFSSGVTTVFNTDTDNSLKLGEGTDETYFAFELGNDIVLKKPVIGRYIRLYNSGFLTLKGGLEPYSNVSELEVYANEVRALDKSSLEEAITKASKYKEKEYTTESWRVFKSALENAQEVNSSNDVTQNEINRAVEALIDAIKGLKKVDEIEPPIIVDRTELDKVIKQAEAIRKEEYTKETYLVLEQAINAAKELKDNASQEEIDQAKDTILEAIEKLEKVTVPKKGAWVKKGLQWKFTYNDGTYECNGFKMIYGEQYYFNQEGYMVTGWEKINNVWYYFGKVNDGIKKTEWVKTDGHWYYMGTDGKMVTGWTRVSGKWYYFKSNGNMSTGWYKEGATWYYLKSSGSMATGWVKDAGKWYYMNKSGSMQTGWQKVYGSWYYMDKNGKMLTGWQKIRGKWYYLKSNGMMARGWTFDGKRTYYLNSVTGAWNGSIK